MFIVLSGFMLMIKGWSYGGQISVSSRVPPFVTINEWLVNPELSKQQFVELFNTLPSPIDLSLFSLSDDMMNPVKFVIPIGTIIQPRGFVVFDESTLGFPLSTAGESLVLYDPVGEHVDSIDIETLANGISQGRGPDGGFDIFGMVPTVGYTNLPLLITTQPQDRVVGVDSSTTFDLEAEGLEPFSYQWSKDRLPISGATDSSYTISNVQPSDAGQYSAQIAKETGTLTSRAATLTVCGPLSISQSDNQLTISWPGNGTLQVANQVSGPWVSLPNNSPYSIPLSVDHGFFRLQCR